MNECANTDNMSDVHCKVKRPGARVKYMHTNPWRPGIWPVSQRWRMTFCPCF